MLAGWLTGWLAVWHIIQPLVGALLVFISINYRKAIKHLKGKKEDGENLEAGGNGERNKNTGVGNSSFCNRLWLAFLTVCSLVPIPVFTNIYGLQLNIKSHVARSREDFQKGIVKFEDQIRKHAAIGNI